MSLPSGYKRLEYIQSTGTQYVNTRITINATTYKRYRFLFDIGYPYIGGTYWLVNGNSGSNVIYYFGLSNTGKIVYGNGTTDVFGSVTATTGRYLIDFNPAGGSYKFGDLQHLTGLKFNAPSGSQNFYLFAYNKGNGQDMHTERLYSAKIYDNGALIRDYIPCQTTAGEIGLWDDVNSVFYGNAGTGTFTAGPVIAIAADKSEITKLEYIQSSGTQYINTGFKPNQDTRLEIVAAPMSIDDAAQGTGFIPYGAGASYNSNAFECYTVSHKFEFNYAGQYDFIGTATIGTVVTIDHNKNNVSVKQDSQVVASKIFNYKLFSAPYNLTLFGINRGSVLCGLLRLYSCQIYDNGTLVRDFVPCINDLGEVGLYDLVEKMFYINVGTGTFISGGYALNLPVNIGGAWKDANEAFVNIGGTWKAVEAAFVNIGGTWKELG